VSADDDWTLDRARLGEALDRWRAQRPDAVSTKHVHEFLMDLVKDPQSCGRPDEHGVWVGWAGPIGRQTIILYDIDLKRRRVFVADISSWDPAPDD
jgi:hypothetical protein